MGDPELSAITFGVKRAHLIGAESTYSGGQSGGTTAAICVALTRIGSRDRLTADLIGAAFEAVQHELCIAHVVEIEVVAANADCGRRDRIGICGCCGQRDERDKQTSEEA